MINTETQELPSAVEETQVETVAEPTMQEVISDQLSESPQLERDESGRFVRKPEVKEPEPCWLDEEETVCTPMGQNLTIFLPNLVTTKFLWQTYLRRS